MHLARGGHPRKAWTCAACDATTFGLGSLSSISGRRARTATNSRKRSSTNMNDLPACLLPGAQAWSNVSDEVTPEDNASSRRG